MGLFNRTVLHIPESLVIIRTRIDVFQNGRGIDRQLLHLLRMKGHKAAKSGIGVQHPDLKPVSRIDEHRIPSLPLIYREDNPLFAPAGSRDEPVHQTRRYSRLISEHDHHFAGRRRKPGPPPLYRREHSEAKIRIVNEPDWIILRG